MRRTFRADLPRTLVSNSLTPTAGARLLLERMGACDATATAARYRAAIFTPTATFEGSADLADSGTVSLAIAADSEYVAALEMLAKLTARAANKRRSDGLPPWPERVLRWRGPGRGDK